MRRIAATYFALTALLSMSCSSPAIVAPTLVLPVALFLLLPLALKAQQAPDGLPFQTVELRDMTAFQTTGTNWSIAGGVTASFTEDRMIETVPGTGILINMPSETSQDNLFTAWEHADLELDIAFMMPKASNSGIYFQGRYEIQLLDSWLVKEPGQGDAGGIYQRWDESRGEGNEGFEGHPPRLNVSRAPGLWQHLHIVFRAPRFDAQGQKTANAMFEKVVFNGIVIHENVELFGPTRGAAFEEEQATGPIMIQGDHGPIAFRNIRYKKYGGAVLELADIQYQYFDGEFESPAALAGASPQQEGTLEELTSAVADARDKFGLIYTGTLSVPTSGDYFFDLVSTGASHIRIDGRLIAENNGEQRVNQRATRTIALDTGQYPFTIAYVKPRPPWRGPSLGLWYEGPEMRRTALTAQDSYANPNPAEPIIVDVEEEAIIHRAFLMHQGTKYTHSAAVGFPEDIHFMVDFQQGAVLNVWKGDFVDATDMWHERGEPQTASPLGSVIEFEAAPFVQALSNVQSAWESAGNLVFKGYTLNASRQPTFTYQLGEVAVQDAMLPDAELPIFNRTVVAEGTSADPLWVRLAVSDRIEAQEDGRFVVGDNAYYIAVTDGNAQVRTYQGQYELIVPLDFSGNRAEVSYSIIW